MPRNVNPSTLTPGGGLAPPGTVEDNSLRYPERDVDPLRAHIHDPVRAHMASAIGIVDAGGYYTSNNVEGALQEIGGGNAASFASRQNGWVSAGTSDFTTAVTTSGASITLQGTWVAITNSGLVTVSGLGFTLTGAAGDYWIYLDGNTGQLAQLAAPAVPDITSDEDIPVGLFAFDGATITGQIDARFFVRNDNRKITYTVRGDGAEEDANSEGAFATIEGAFTWLQAYTTGTGGVSQKSRLTLRGSFTVSNTITVPVDNLEIIGEDGAEITSTVSGSGGVTLDLSGRQGVVLRNITFLCNSSSSVIAISNTTGDVSGLVVDRCIVANGGENWGLGIAIAAGSGSIVRVTNCRVSSVESVGIGFLGEFDDITITDNYVDGFLTDFVDPTATGIVLAGDSGISGNRPSNAIISGNTVYRCAVGVSVEGNYDARAHNDCTVANPVTIADNDTLVVTAADGTPYTLTARASAPVGIDEFLIAGTATATNIINAINDPDNSFYTSVAHAVSTGGAGIRFYAVPQGEVGNAFTLAQVIGSGITIPSSAFVDGFDGSIQGITISENTVTNCAFASGAPPLFTYSGTGAIGVGLSFTRDCRVVGNIIREIGILINSLGDPILPSVGGSIVNSAGVTAWNSTRFSIEQNNILNTTGTSGGVQRGVYVAVGGQGVEETFTNDTSNASVCDNKINWSLEGNFAATANATYGSLGIHVESTILVSTDSSLSDYSIQGLQVCRNEVNQCGGRGIRLAASERSHFIGTSVNGNTVSLVDSVGIDINIGAITNTAGLSQFETTEITGNVLQSIGTVGVFLYCDRGAGPNSFSQVLIADNQIRQTGDEGIAVTAVAEAAFLPDINQIDIRDNQLALTGIAVDTPPIPKRAILISGVPNDDLSVSSSLENIRIIGNSITDSGSPDAHAIEFNSTNWEPLNIEVSENIVSGTGGNPSPGGGFRMNITSTNPVPTSYGARGVRAADNTFFLSGTLPVGTAQITVTAPFTAMDTLRFFFPPTGSFIPLTAVAVAPTTDQFQITGTINGDATAITNALNNPSNSFSEFITASNATPGTVALVAGAAMPGSMSGMTGPVQTGASVTAIVPFTGTGVGGEERRATFIFIVGDNTGFTPNTSNITLTAPGAIANQTLTFGPNPGQIPIGVGAATTAANIVSTINSTPAFANLASAAIYPDVFTSGRVIILTAGDYLPGRLGNYATFTFGAGSPDAILYGNDDQFFSYGEDDMINGVSIEADGLIVQSNIQRNQVSYLGSDATSNRRPAFIRTKQAVFPQSFDVPAFGSITVVATGTPPTGIGDTQTFIIDDGVNPAVTFEYVIPDNGTVSNPSNVPIGLDPGSSISAVTSATANAIRGVSANGGLFVQVVGADTVTGVITLAGPPQASISGSITVSGLPLVAGAWSVGVLEPSANSFGQSFALNIEDNNFYGGIGSQVEVLNGFTVQGLSFSRNRVGRPDVAVVACSPGVTYPGYYHGFSVFIRSGLVSAAGYSLTGADQSVAVVFSDNDFTNLGHGASHLYKSETKNNLSPFVIDTSFTDNRIYNCGLSNVSPTMLGLEVFGGDYERSVVAATIVEGNNIENSVVRSTGGRATNIGVAVIYTAAANSAHILIRGFIGITDANVGDNTILGGSSTAALVDQASQVAAAVSVFPGYYLSRNITVSGNRIHGVTLNSTSIGSTRIVAASHIFVGSPLSPAEGFVVGLSGADISNNIIAEHSNRGEFWNSSTSVLSTGSVPYVSGITLNGFIIAAGVSIDHNLIDLAQPNITSNSIIFFNGHILTSSRILLGPGGFLIASSISGNDFNVSNNGTSVSFQQYTYAVFNQMSMTNVKIDGNKAALSGDSVGGLFIGNAGSLWGTGMVGSTVSNNSMTAVNNGTSVDQRFIGVFTNLGVFSSSVSNNTLSSNFSTPFDFGIVIDDITPTVRNSTLSNNNIISTEAIYMGSAIEDCMVEGNTVRGSAGLSQGILFKDVVTNTAISANTVSVTGKGFVFDDAVNRSAIVGNSTRAVDKGMEFGGAISAITISGNSINANTTGFEFISTLSSPAITGNTVHGDTSTDAATGGTPASPASGTCTGNVGANLGVGATWDDWADNTGTPRVAVYRIGATPLND